MRTGKYCTPHNAGLASEPHAVGRAIAKALDAMSNVNNWLVEAGEGTIENDMWTMRMSIIDKLKAEGWRISTPRNRYSVLPPKGGK